MVIIWLLMTKKKRRLEWGNQEEQSTDRLPAVGPPNYGHRRLIRYSVTMATAFKIYISGSAYVYIMPSSDPRDMYRWQEQYIPNDLMEEFGNVIPYSSGGNVWWCPTLQGVTLASPTLQGVTLASVPVNDPDKKMSVDNRTWFFRSFRLTVLSGIL